MTVTLALPPRVRSLGLTAAHVAMVGVVLYVLIDVVLQFLPPHYSPISDAESNLAVGPYGYIMNLNFLGRAVFCVAVVVALAVAARHRAAGQPNILLGAGLLFLLLGGASSAVLAFFPTDVGPAATNTLQSLSTVGTIHFVVATFGFVSALLAVVLLTVWMRLRRVLPGGHRRMFAFSGLTLAGLLLVVAAYAWVPGIVGLAERVALVGILAWTFSAAASIRRLLYTASTETAKLRVLPITGVGERRAEGCPTAANPGDGPALGRRF